MQVNTGNRIAQLQLSPYIKVKAITVERAEGLGNTGKHVFQQTVANDWNRKLKLQVNNTEIEDLDTEVDVTIIS